MVSVMLLHAVSDNLLATFELPRNASIIVFGDVFWPISKMAQLGVSHEKEQQGEAQGGVPAP